MHDHQARNCTNAWNVPPAPAAPDPYPPAAPAPPPPAGPVPSPPAGPAPSPSVVPGQHPGASQSVPAQVHSATPVSSQNPLLAGLPLGPDSPLTFSGMPPLEKLPGDPPTPSSAGTLDQHGFLVNQPSHPGVSIPNPSFSSPSVSTLSSTLTLGNSSVGGQSSSIKSNVGDPKGSGMSIVGGQKSPANSNVSLSNVGSQKSSAISTVVGQSGPSLTYSGVVGLIPNSNLPISSPPNSNPPNSSVQISASNSVQNSVPNSAGLIPDVQIIGSNSVAPVDSEMAAADDPLWDPDDLSLDEVRALKKFLSPCNVKRIGLAFRMITA